MKEFISKLHKLKEDFTKIDFKSKDKKINWILWFKDYERVCDQIQQGFFEVSFKSDCNTSDEGLKAQLEEFYTEVMPVLDILNNEIQMMLPEKEVEKLSKGLAEAIRIEKRTFNKVSVEELFPREQILGQEYSDITGSLSIEHKGATLSMSSAWDLIQRSPQEEREEIFNKVVGAWQSVRERINSIYIELVSIRRQIAINAGFTNYSGYFFYSRAREWSPKQCFDFHENISKHVLPVQEQVHRRWLEMVPNLKPWNLSPLEDSKKVFETEAEFKDLIWDCIHKMPPQVQDVHLSKIRKDLMNRLNKKVGGYCGWMPITKDNILLMNATGTDEDMFTYFHELGHAVHHSLSGDFQSSFEHESQVEFAEVASMSMELLSLKYLGNAGMDTRRITREKFEGDVTFLPYMSVVDLFQHWVYTTTEDITSESLDAKWKELFSARTGLADYTGYEDYLSFGWQRKAHIIENPFYYIEYGISQLGAWQVYSNSRVDEPHAWTRYFDALSRGGSMEIEKLYETAGIKFPLTHPGVVRSYALEITEELKGYNN